MPITCSSVGHLAQRFVSTQSTFGGSVGIGPARSVEEHHGIRLR